LPFHRSSAFSRILRDRYDCADGHKYSLRRKNPVAGIIHSLTLFAIIIPAAPLARNVPLATLGAIPLSVIYNMDEWHEFVKHFTNNYRVILLATFLLTVIVDLTVAVEIGLALSFFFFFATRISSLTRLEPVPEVEAQGHARIGGAIETHRFYGSLFFGSATSSKS
jgi:SulP family sulfate permease